MLTLVIRAGESAEPLVESLTPLVAGVVKGLVGSVFIVSVAEAASATEPDIAAVASEAGATLIVAKSWQAALADVSARSRAPYVGVIDSGVVVDEFFWPAIERFLRQAQAKPGIAATRSHLALRERLLPLRRWLGGVGPDQVVIVPASTARQDPWSQRHRGLVRLESWSRRLS